MENYGKKIKLHETVCFSVYFIFMRINKKLIMKNRFGINFSFNFVNTLFFDGVFVAFLMDDYCVFLNINYLLL